MVPAYDAVMNAEKNPLSRLPASQRFQVMLYLSVMWTTLFCVGAGAWMWYGELIVAHVAIAFGVVATGYTFRRASRATYRDFPAQDGTARYDDVWGA